ncbi:bacteriocin immunity protein [Maribacter luteus]|uniref:bacteriocin immunity protein n=1 Tax=Maribacter luteus TaxID=2594478 RepID=UPI002490251E|nr:bacteriocin immunity protein [Maribacter luteus]
MDIKEEKMTREELIELEKRIVNCQGTEDEIDEMIQVFNKNVSHPKGASLFYSPENYNARRDKISDYNPTVEEVVDKALSYKPIQL